ncbi:MAG: response regulator [Deltaproteobacteria bacterium]|nr:response regulator [Deltaproteobacteria bacterium]
MNINDVLTDTLRMLRRIISDRIEIELRGAHEMPLVLVDRAQIEQVIMNLCVNSRDAMPSGGKLLLKTEEVTLDERFRESHPWARWDRYVSITVADTGTGIPPDKIDSIFEPFFTTKEHGNGLGLATVYGIVRHHGGHVEVHSQINEGTTFKVYLPVSARQATQTESSKEEPVRGGTETILVAEDEPSVRAVVVHVLSDAGYRVLPARDGVEAVSVFRAQAKEVDLILMDAVMPRGGGAEAVAAIRAVSPQAKIVISSGYTESIGDGGLANWNVEFLAKPYEPKALLRIIRQTLDK